MTMMLALLSGFHPFFYNLLTATVLRFMSDVRKADEKAEDEGRGFCNTLFIPFRPSTYMALLVRVLPDVATEANNFKPSDGTRQSRALSVPPHMLIVAKGRLLDVECETIDAELSDRGLKDQLVENSRWKFWIVAMSAAMRYVWSCSLPWHDPEWKQTTDDTDTSKEPAKGPPSPLAPY